MSADLIPIRRRLATAKEELDALRGEVDAFMSRPPWRLERDDGPLHERLVSHIDHEPDPEWGDRIGYIAHKIRSSLDQLVKQLVMDSGGTPGGGNYFPIYITSTEYFGKRKKGKAPRDTKLDGVASRHRKIIDEVQPFQRGRVADARRDPLFVINAISNEDKHNDTHAVWGAVSGTHVRVTWPGQPTHDIRISQRDDPKPLVDGQVVFGVDSNPDDGLSRARLEVVDVQVGLVFQGRVTVTLDDVEQALLAVSALVDRFERRIQNRNQKVAKAS